ncbi:MAG: DNA-directed RNA polymerase subunit B, partial [Candidatus Altiarchaeota archaeon]|nr:DNA-directed RNA polymerase subunit B [Candidatus Altiarchaeota archaeon]
MSTGVYLNGRLIGTHNQPELLVKKIRDLRRKGKMDYTTSISFREENNEVQIYTDKGRVLRPILILEDGKPLMTERHVKDLKEKKVSWDELIKEGVVEYIDAEEEENAYIAVREYKIAKEHTHLEITPSLILGISAGFAPFPEHNSSPRVTMAAAMAKQSLGFYASNYASRFDSRANL